MWRVYLLRCHDDSYYCGVSNDVLKRLVTHRSGRGSKYVRARLPCYLVAQSPAMSKSEALRFEAAVKRLPRGAKPAQVTLGPLA